MGRIADKVSYKVKNTFVEFGPGEPEGYERVRARSDATDVNKRPPKGPQTPEEFAELEAAQKAKLVVPNTPSPFLHPSTMEPNGDVPPLNLTEAAGGYEMTTFGDIGPEELYGQPMTCFDGSDMQGFCGYGLPAVVFDPSTGEFGMGGWYMTADAMVMAAQGSTEADACASLGQPLEALMDGSMPFDGTVGDGQPPAEQGGILQALPENGWTPDGGMHMESGQLSEVAFKGQGWSPDGCMQMEQGGAMAEMASGDGWSKDGCKSTWRPSQQ